MSGLPTGLGDSSSSELHTPQHLSDNSCVTQLDIYKDERKDLNDVLAPASNDEGTRISYHRRPFSVSRPGFLQVGESNEKSIAYVATDQIGEL